MADSPIALQDVNSVGFNQAAATNASGYKVPQFALATWTSGVPAPVDNSNPIPVDITDSTIAATQSGTWTVQPGNTANTTPWLFSIHDGTNKASVRTTGSSSTYSLNVAIVDASGNQITSFGGGSSIIQYTEGDVDTTITGDAILWEDASDTLATVKASKPLPVQILPPSTSANTYVTYTETQLTAPGTTTTRNFAAYKRATCWVNLASINTSVTVQIEGRPTSSGSWYSLIPRSLNASPASETLTGNGLYVYQVDTTAEELRFNFVSESGGTTATLDVVWRFSV